MQHRQSAACYSTWQKPILMLEKQCSQEGRAERSMPSAHGMHFADQGALG